MSKFTKTVEEIIDFANFTKSSSLENDLSKVMRDYFKSNFFPTFQSEEKEQKSKNLFREECGEELNAIWDKYIALYPDYKGFIKNE